MGTYLMRHDGIVVDALSRMEDEDILAVLYLYAALHAVEPLFSLMAVQLVGGLTGRSHRDDEGVHMTRRASSRQAEVAEVSCIAGGLERFYAFDLFHLLRIDIGRPEGFIIIHERSQANSQRPCELDERS